MDQSAVQVSVHSGLLARDAKRAKREREVSNKKLLCSPLALFFVLCCALLLHCIVQQKRPLQRADCLPTLAATKAG